MLPALRDNERRLLIHVALMLSCGSLSLLPLTAESSSTGTAEAGATGTAAIEPAGPEVLRFPTISLERDPFVPDRTDPGLTHNDPFQSNRAIGIVLPPNAGASNLPLPDPVEAGAPEVRAVILGAQSKALVDISGEVRVLGIGDRVGFSPIASVDARGVVLNNGVRIPLLERH